MKTIELIVPCYNEEKCISKFYDRVQEVFSDMPECTFIITFVDDGSNDNTMDEIKKVEKRADAGKIQYISLSRNFLQCMRGWKKVWEIMLQYWMPICSIRRN